MTPSTFTSIEKVAMQLDEARQTRLKDHRVDFDAYLKARNEDIASIKTTTELRADLHDEFFGDASITGRTLPWSNMQDHFRVRPGELTIWSGYNGHMKSMVTGYVMLDLMRQGEKVCIASFEMKPQKTLRRMASQAIGTTNPTPQYVDKFMDAMAGKLWLYTQLGDTTPERVLGVIYYCAEQLGVTQFVIDSLMKVCGNEDDYNEQKRFIGRLCTAAKDLNIHIHLVTHARKGVDENKMPGKQDNKGTGAIVDQTDNFISVFKLPEKKEGDEEQAKLPDFVLGFQKQRHGEWEGKLALWFNKINLQFTEVKDGRPRRFLD